MSFHYWRNARPRRKNGLRRRRRAAITARRCGALAVTDVPLCSATLTRRLLRAVRRQCPRPTRGSRRRRLAARARAQRRGRARGTISPCITTTIAALIVEPLVQGAAGMAMYDPAYLRSRARAVHALRRPPDRRRDHDRLRPHRNACSPASRRRSHPTCCACRRASPAATCRCRCVLTTDDVYEAFYDDDAGARLPAFAFVHRQRACLPRGAGGARPLSRRRRARGESIIRAPSSITLARPLAAHRQSRELPAAWA